jgi:hypothetical protein
VHPDIVRLVSLTSSAGVSCAVITNGWFLPRYIAALAAAGLSRLIVSIDSSELGAHERNRGLAGLALRLVDRIAAARARGLPVQASVTVNRLVRYDELPATLRRLGFDDVSFSYPRREPLGSSAVAYGAGSSLVDLDRDELLAALEAIRRLRNKFPVLNPRASLAEVARYLRGKPQAVPASAATNTFISTGTSTSGAARPGSGRSARFSIWTGSRTRANRQRLHDGLLPQCQHADACRRRDGRRGARPGRRPYRRCRGSAVPGRRRAIAAGAGRGAAANASPPNGLRRGPGMACIRARRSA